MPRPGQAAVQADLGGQYRELRGVLLAFLRRQVGDAATAEDLLHDVMLKAIVAGQQERTEAVAARRNPAGWLYTIARNAAIDHLRARRPTAPLPEELAAPEHEDDAVPEALLQCVRRMAEHLPPLYRDTLRAADFDGRTLQSLADAEGVSLSAIKSRASRGRRLLQAELLCCCREALAGWDALTECRPEGPACDPSSPEPGKTEN